MHKPVANIFNCLNLIKACTIFQRTDLGPSWSWFLASLLLRQTGNAFGIHCCYTYRSAAEAKKIHDISSKRREWTFHCWINTQQMTPVLPLVSPYQWAPKAGVNWLATPGGGKLPAIEEFKRLDNHVIGTLGRTQASEYLKDVTSCLP